MDFLYKYSHPLTPAIFLKRYKRFLADVQFEHDSTPTTVHCANSGSMKSCQPPHARAYTLDSQNPTRKLQHTLELIELEDGLCCINTQRANDCAYTFLQAHVGGLFPAPPGTLVQREVAFNAHTRFDFCLTYPSHDGAHAKKCWIEIKSVSLRLDEQTLAFPDAVTTRGQKHLQELMHARTQGDDAWMIFVIMRAGDLDIKTIVSQFRIAHEIDPSYATQYQLARTHHMRVGLLLPTITPQGFSFRHFEEI